MNCRKCLHFLVCTYNDKSGKGFDCSQAENCPFFRNRHNFIELPCEIGDEKFAILPFTDVIVKGKVCTLIYQNEFLIDFGYNPDKRFGGYNVYTQLSPEELFDTYEEAEKALERSENGK